MPSAIVKSKQEVNKLLNWVDGNVCKALDGGPVEVVLRRPDPPKSDIQREKFHAMIGDINKTGIIRLPGKVIDFSKYDKHQCKALLVNWFANEKAEMGDPLPKPPRSFPDPITGQMISIRPSTRDWGKKLTCEFVEWLYYTGSFASVVWSEPALKEYETYRESQQ